ncbi:MAG: hypothetical protein H7246_03770 [Phycisphaerae bacterium]|nr:hypothetical protein [Saprospiraceae bacterium]
MSNSENPTHTTQENNTIPPPKQFAKRSQILWLAFYFVLTGILLLQNVYSFWPPTEEIAKYKTLMLAENTEKIKSLREDFKTAVSDKDSLQIKEAIEQIESTQIGLLASQSDTSKNREIRVRVLCYTSTPYPVDKDQCYLLLVLIMGAVGSWLHAVSSCLDFVGNRNFVASWITWYLMRPILGSMMAVVFYVVIRAGLFPQGGGAIDAINPFSIAALAGMVGLFTQRASKKLGDVFDALFPTLQKDKDPLESKPETITQLMPAQFAVGATSLKVQVSGSNFTSKSNAFVNGKHRNTNFIDKGNLEFMLDPEDVATAGNLQVTVYDPALGLGTGVGVMLPVVPPAG